MYMMAILACSLLNRDLPSEGFFLLCMTAPDLEIELGLPKLDAICCMNKECKLFMGLALRGRR